LSSWPVMTRGGRWVWTYVEWCCMVKLGFFPNDAYTKPNSPRWLMITFKFIWLPPLSSWRSSLNNGTPLRNGTGTLAILSRITIVRVMSVAFAAYRTRGVVHLVKCLAMTVHWVRSIFSGLMDELTLIISVVWGECTHVFHMHCLLKWIGTVASKQQCPMDRRAWGTLV
jgi:hypothetical protein